MLISNSKKTAPQELSYFFDLLAYTFTTFGFIVAIKFFAPEFLGRLRS